MAKSNAGVSLWLLGRRQRPMPLRSRGGVPVHGAGLGALIDRIDLHLEVPPVPFEHLSGEGEGSSSGQIKDIKPPMDVSDAPNPPVSCWKMLARLHRDGPA